MFSIFLLTLLAALAILRGHRRTGIGLSVLSAVLLAGLLAHHATSRLAISL